MKNRILLISVAVMLVIGLVVTGCAKPAPAPTPAPTPAPAPAPTPTPKVYEWKLHGMQPAGAKLQDVDLARYAEMVEEYTQGRIKVTTYPAGAIVSISELLDAVADNVVQMVQTPAGYWGGKIPVATVEYGAPMTVRTNEERQVLMWYRGLEDVVREAYAEHGIYYVGFETPTPDAILSTKPLRSLEDFVGLKIRAHGQFATFYDKLGASPVTLPIPEVYMALKLGTVDAADSGVELHYDLKLYETGKYMTLPYIAHGTPLNMLANLDEWNKLPDDLKSILTLLTREWSTWTSLEVAPRRQKASEDGLREKGVEFIELPLEDAAKMQAAAAEMWDDWAAKDAYSARAVAIMKDYLREKGYID